MAAVEIVDPLAGGVDRTIAHRLDQDMLAPEIAAKFGATEHQCDEQRNDERHFSGRSAGNVANEACLYRSFDQPRTLAEIILEGAFSVGTNGNADYLTVNLVLAGCIRRRSIKRRFDEENIREPENACIEFSVFAGAVDDGDRKSAAIFLRRTRGDCRAVDRLPRRATIREGVGRFSPYFCMEWICGHILIQRRETIGFISQFPRIDVPA